MYSDKSAYFQKIQIRTLMALGSGRFLWGAGYYYLFNCSGNSSGNCHVCFENSLQTAFVEATVYCKIMFKLMRLGSYLVMFYHILMVDFIKAYY